MNEREKEREREKNWIFQVQFFIFHAHVVSLSLLAWYRRFSLEGGYKAIIPSQLIPSVF